MLLLLCLVMGLMWGMLFAAGMNLAGIPMDWMDAVWSGLLFGVLIFPVFRLLGRQQRRRAEAAKQKLPSPPTHGWLAVMVEGKKSRSVAVFLCEDCLCLANLDKKTVPISLYPCKEIVRAATPAVNHLEIHLTRNRSLLLRLGANTDDVLSDLKDRGWLPFQH